MRTISYTKKKIIADLYKLGYSIKDVADITAVSPMTVSNALKTVGVAARPKNTNIRPDEDIMEAYLRIKKANMLVVNEKPINCNTKAADKCIYKSKRLAVNQCDYCIRVGKMRGGSPEECYKYAF